MQGILCSLALALVAVAVGWLALEMRVFHRVIRYYANEMRLWTDILRRLEERHYEERDRQP